MERKELRDVALVGYSPQIPTKPHETSISIYYDMHQEDFSAGVTSILTMELLLQ